MSFTLNRQQAKQAVIKCLKNYLVPLLISPPGFSKSSLAFEISESLNTAFIDLRPTCLLPEDLNGFAHINKEVNKSEYIPFDSFPLEGDPLPEGKNGWVLLIDELPQASKEIQNSLFKIILDRKVANYKLHPNCVIMCAGNREQDNAFTNPLNTALKSRLIHLELQMGVDEWIEYANANKIDNRIIAFVNYKGYSALSNFDPESEDKTYSCPRTLTFLDKLIKDTNDLSEIDYLVAGTIGESMTYEFITFTKLFMDLPKITEIMNGTVQDIPTDPAKKYAIIQHIISKISTDNFVKVLPFVEKFPIEFQIIFARSLNNMNPDLKTENSDFSNFLIKMVNIK